MYMISMDSSLLPVPSPGVIPVDNPTVPNALVTSNRASLRDTAGSMTVMKYVPVITTETASSVITAAFLNAALGTD